MNAKVAPRWLLHTVFAVFLVLVFLMLASIILWQSKKSTCQSIGDVWADVGILISQHTFDALDMPHNLSSLGIYLTSNTLDGTLYECRVLLGSDAVLDEVTSKYIFLPTQSRSLRSYTTPDEPLHAFARDEIHLMLCSEKTEWHENPTTFDYVRSVNMIDLYGWVLYPEGEDNTMVGYLSKLSISTGTTQAGGDTISTQNVYTSDYVDTFNDANKLSDKASLDSLVELLNQQGMYFDFSVLKYTDASGVSTKTGGRRQGDGFPRPHTRKRQQKTKHSVSLR